MRRGEPWERPASGPPTVEVDGGDPELAAAVARAPGALVWFRPAEGSDLAGAVGLRPVPPGADRRSPGTIEVAMDALAVGGDLVAVNAVVLGVAPDRLGRLTRSVQVRVTVDGRPVVEGRATTVLCATGQWLRSRDVVPRGHPGDGRMEVQVYSLRPSERSGMRRRLARGEHVPHPHIEQASGRRVEIEAGAELPLEVDGRACGRAASLTVELRAGAYRLLV